MQTTSYSLLGVQAGLLHRAASSWGWGQWNAWLPGELPPPSHKCHWAREVDRKPILTLQDHAWLFQLLVSQGMLPLTQLIGGQER